MLEFALELLKNNRLNEAIPLLQLGAQRQHPQMMTELAMICTDEAQADYYNLEEALQLYKDASALGEKNAWNNLGYHLQNGIGCTQDVDKAIEAYTKAAELGNGLGWENLANLYYFGQLIEQDYDKALEYYLKAQKLYHFNEDKLTEIYFSKGDYKKVLPLLKKDYEETFSPIYYGIMYEEGYGIKANLKKALAYYEKAMHIGNYPYAMQKILFHYRKESTRADQEKFKNWLQYAEENEIEIDRQQLGLEEPKKSSFFKKLFKS